MLSLNGSVLCRRVFFSSLSIYLGAVGDQGPKLGRQLLYSSLSVSFGLRGVGRLALRLNNAAVGYSLFPFGQRFLSFFHCFLSLNQSFLAYIQFRFALSKLCFSGQVLFLAGANHRQRDEHRKDKHFFHISSKL